MLFLLCHYVTLLLLYLSLCHVFVIVSLYHVIVTVSLCHLIVTVSFCHVIVTLSYVTLLLLCHYVTLPSLSTYLANVLLKYSINLPKVLQCILSLALCHSQLTSSLTSAIFVYCVDMLGLGSGLLNYVRLLSFLCWRHYSLSSPVTASRYFSDSVILFATIV